MACVHAVFDAGADEFIWSEDEEDDDEEDDAENDEDSPAADSIIQAHTAPNVSSFMGAEVAGVLMIF